ncbi:related to tyrosinase precursor (monophenol monooxygenase) [Serendipita indica DSM 11827]|uniref:tyrosinase n=1 Tax=Serendipita indica (strain DSM 11827) TaxID=1109443 RepID=G4TM93_SERID|nr:related to tyrosinase precursor (monophenol monooxygenase) [Serendipita indica DSM 11827]
MVLTTGVTGGPLVARQEIRVFAQNQDLMNLYLQGLDRFQRTDQKELLSYFQIAGIHGRPYIPYDGSGSAGNFGGYCTHSSILFPPWHRPYLALFEQVLYKHVNDIAASYTDAAKKTKYQAAARSFRIPYWDWALNADLPDFVSQQTTVTVDTPTGQQTIPNPLYQYTFHPVYSDFGDGLPDEKTWESWQSTLRWPSARTAAGRSQPLAMENNLQNNRLTLRDRTYNLLTQARNYEAFSNDGFMGSGTDPTFYDSLESIHGQIHVLTGRNGHMGVVDYAAFDPVFWLHHTNCDRLFAMWQALNPTAYVGRRVNQAGTFATKRGTMEDVNSPLAPFWKSQGVYWTSADARDTRALNYTYPELEKWASLTPQDKAVRLRSDINIMYGKSAPFAAIVPDLFTLKPQLTTTNQANLAVIGAKKPAGRIATAAAAPAAKVAAQPAGGAQPAQQPLAKQAATTVSQAASTVAGAASGAAQKVAATLGAPAAQPAGKSGHSPPSLPSRKAARVADGKKHYNEWIANITVEKYAAKKTFMVHIFLGDFNPDPAQWGTDPNLVGTHAVFANNMNFTGCENCRDAAERHKLVTGTIPLTGALGDRLGKNKVSHLEPAEIIPYLKKELHWRIQDQDDVVIERDHIPSLKVSVAHVEVAIPESIAEFPVWSGGIKDPEITTGRLGGATEND